MAWNQPGEDKKRPPPRGAPNTPLDDLLRRLQRQVQRLWRPGSSRGTAAFSLLLLIVVLWLLSGYYQIGPGERGVVQRFGVYVAVEQPGRGWHWPWPIETISKLDVLTVESQDSKALMPTDDGSLVDISWSVQYRIGDPLRFLFDVRDPEASLRQASETVMRELIGGVGLGPLLDGQARARIAAQARARIQSALDAYGAGISLTGVSLSDVRLPDAVLAAQRDAAKAADDRKHALSAAQAYAGDILPKAQSAAQRQMNDAETYAAQTRATAEGDAERFTLLAQAYARAPEITRSRMYIDTMEGILSHAHKIVIDTRSGSGNMIYVPLDKLAEVMRAAVPASPAGSAAAPAPAPAAGASGSAAPAESSESSDAAGDARDRERPER
ncbi:MAG TPA: FtsH protease activity modulator HflK [Steroidobacteraceae bacterium]